MGEAGQGTPVMGTPHSQGHPGPPRGSPNVLEKTGRAELSTSKETQFPMIWGGRRSIWGGAVLPGWGRGSPVPETHRDPARAWGCAGGSGRWGDMWWPHVGTPHSTQGHTQPCTAGTRGPAPRGGPRSPPAPAQRSHLGEGGVLPLGEQPGEEGGAVEAHDGGEHQVAARGVKEENGVGWPWGQRWGHECPPEGYKMRMTCRAAPKEPKMEKETWPRDASCRERRRQVAGERVPGWCGTRLRAVPCPPTQVPGCPVASRHRPAAAPGRGSRR